MGRASILWLAACSVLGLLCLWCGSDADRGPAVAPNRVASSKAAAEYRTRNIQDLRKGDMVVAWDPVTGEMGRHEIVNSFQRTADQLRVLEFLAADGARQTLSTTDEHPFWSVDAEDYIAAGDLQLGDHLIGPAGEIATLIGSRCEEYPAGVAVYNFEVSGVHNYYVRANGLRAPPLRVHNATGLDCLIGRGGAKRTLGKYEVGTYEDLRAHGEAGLNAHHAGQKALMKKFISNYDPDTAPSILLPREGHTIRGPRGIVSRSMKGFTNVRDVLARDIRELRRVYPDLPNSKLKELLQLNKDMYPELWK